MRERSCFYVFVSKQKTFSAVVINSSTSGRYLKTYLSDGSMFQIFCLN